MGVPTADRKDVHYTPVIGQNGEDKTSQLPAIGIRHWQALLLFLMGFIGFGFRVILSVAIVAMTDPKASINPDVPTYEWKDKGSILSAFFWGYIWFQIIAGYVANRFGPKWFLIGAMFIQSFLGILTPYTAAQFGSRGMCVSRALQGLCQGFIFPSATHQLSQWVPIKERSRLGAFIFGGGPLGSVVAMLVTGVISSSWYGWPLVFYVYGGLGLLWCILFAIVGSNSPAVHPSISKAEKYYIEESLGHTDEKLHPKVPWICLLKSVPLWALFIVQIGNTYCFWTMLTQIPSYMHYVMKFDMKNNSILSALPFLAQWLLGCVFGLISDLIINKKLVTISSARKIFNGIGLLVPAAALVVLGFTRADQPAQAVVLLVVAVGANGATGSGWTINHVDLSPNHASTLMGLTNGLSHISAIAAPLIVQLVVTDENNPQQWQVIFSLSAGIVTTVAIIYIIFGSGTVQPWNDDSQEEEKD